MNENDSWTGGYVENAVDGVIRSFRSVPIAISVLALAACSEVVPTAVGDALIPDEPVTVEVRLTWDEFASNLQVLGGYGSPQELGTGVVAHLYAGALEARTLVGFAPYPTTASLPDSTGTTRVDSTLTRIGGRVGARLDTLTSVLVDGVAELALGATTQEWHARTAKWDFAVDTVQDQRPWSEPGGGPVTPLATAVWDPALGDSVVFELDSAQVELWADTADVTRGARLEALTTGARLKILDVNLRIEVRPSVHPDTVVEVTAVRNRLTFIYSPNPEPPADGIRIGGAPAWRSILDVAVPAQLDGPAELCAAVGCPVPLTSRQLNHASLILTTRRPDPAFQPTDTVGVDLRPVLDRDALPKAPLGLSLVGALGKRVPPSLFGDDEGTEVEVPLTAFVKAILESDEGADASAPRTLAILSPFEPISISFGSFFGPGTPGAPVLKLIVTAGRSIQLP
jgi:hypothetical protein